MGENEPFPEHGPTGIVGKVTRFIPSNRVALVGRHHNKLEGLGEDYIGACERMGGLFSPSPFFWNGTDRKFLFQHFQIQLSLFVEYKLKSLWDVLNL